MTPHDCHDLQYLHPRGITVLVVVSFSYLNTWSTNVNIRDARHAQQLVEDIESSLGLMRNQDPAVMVAWTVDGHEAILLRVCTFASAHPAKPAGVNEYGKGYPFGVLVLCDTGKEVLSFQMNDVHVGKGKLWGRYGFLSTRDPQQGNLRVESLQICLGSRP